MEISSYVALSGQLALEQRMTVLATNIANANTPGFKSGVMTFESLLTDRGNGGTAFVSAGRDQLNMKQGGLTQTGNLLDLATRGGATFAYQSPQGVYYSSDGRLTISPAGEVLNMQGHNLLDTGGAPLILDPAAGQATFEPDGRMIQAGKTMGQVGLFMLDLAEGFSRFGSSGIVPKIQAEPAGNFTGAGIVQGFIEDSNVNSVTEMVDLIEVSRAFEAASTFADKAMEAERNAIEALGSR
jgi:flagellar basal-body rod protein FlgF